MKKGILIAAFFAVFVVFAGPLYAAPVLDGGWYYDDQISGSWTDSDLSPYHYDLAGPAVFSISDGYVYGDVYKVWDGVTLILTTTFYSGSEFTDSFWTDSGYSKGRVSLGTGSHNLVIQGDGVGGIPAGFMARLDTQAVPEPATMLLFGIGLIGLAGIRKKLS